MRYSEDQAPSPYAVAYIGDGRTDRHILGSLANKFDGKNSGIFYPSTPLAGVSKGLSPIFAALKIEYDKYARGCPALIVVDREHLNSEHAVEAAASGFS